MSEVQTVSGFQVNRLALFRLFKYAVYLLLVYNVFAFFIENHATAAHVFAGGIGLGQVIEVYNDAIDTLAWVLLLLVFELETSVLSDEKLRGRVKWALNTVYAVCYLVVAYSLYGYILQLGSVLHLLPLAQSACDLAASGNWSLALGQYEYETLSAHNCVGLAGSELLRQADAQVIGTAAVWRDLQWLGWLDVINASAWLLLVGLLALDVWLQLRGETSATLVHYSRWVKGFLYATLILCVAAWGVGGAFLWFWDALLWVLAFFFIEMNLFEWQAETGADGGEVTL